MKTLILIFSIITLNTYSGELKISKAPGGVNLSFTADVEDMLKYYTLEISPNVEFSPYVTMTWPCGFCTNCHGCDFGYVIAGYTYTLFVPEWNDFALFFRLRMEPMY